MAVEIKPYERSVNYYETDKMQVVHHSNYARYLEEARFDLMDQAGISYEKLEEKGIIIPVLELHCIYRFALRFGDSFLIYPKIIKLSPVRFTLKYEIRDKETGELKHQAESSHCFVNNEFQPMNLKREHPDVYAVFDSMVDK